jgi:hypothetical protein
LAAADARIHAQNAAMVEQEARLTEANRLLALVSTRYAAARYHYITIGLFYCWVTRVSLRVRYSVVLDLQRWKSQRKNIHRLGF